MLNLKIYPYNMGSEAARELANVLNIMRVRPDGNYVPKMGHVIVNYGNSTVPNWYNTAVRRGNRILNKPEAVAVASNKLRTLEVLRAAGISVPDFTTSIGQARIWLEDGFTIVERHKLNGSSGEGIRIVSLGDEGISGELKTAPLYTKYLYKDREFRVHVFRGQVIDYVEKKKRRGAEEMIEFDRYVYSTERGWVFCRDGIEHLDSVKEIALKSVQTLGLDFGAVDVVVVNGTPYVLEVNSAPGLMGTTLIRYANAIRRFMGASPLPEPARTREPATVPTPTPDEELITLRLDRATARKLQSLLSAVL